MMRKQLEFSALKWILTLALLAVGGVASAGGALPEPESASRGTKGWAVSYREQTAFLVYRDRSGQSAKARSRLASNALLTAIEAGQSALPDSPIVEVLYDNDLAIVKVRGYTVMPLDSQDAEWAGYQELAGYGNFLKEQLTEFVPKQRLRLRIEKGFLRFFLSIFALLMVFLAVRGLSSAFVRADKWLESRRGSFQPIRFFSETLLSGEALAGVAVIVLSLSKILAYFLTVVLGAGFILGQFESTRELLQASVEKLAGLFIESVQTTISLIPGVLLGLILVFGLQASLRVLNLFLRGVSSGRISRKMFPVHRVPALRFLGTMGLLFIFVPLIVLSFFSRFHTPFEIIVLLMAGAFALGFVPLLASLMTGMFKTWKNDIQPGDWVQIGNHSGEVSSISLGEMRVVPVSGGEVRVPMLSLLWHPLKRSKQVPDQIIDLEVVKDRSSQDLIDSIRTLFSDEMMTEVHVKSVSQTHVGMRIISHSPRNDVREKILLEISDAADRGVIQIYEGSTH